MAAFMLESESAKAEVVVFPDAFSKCDTQIVNDAMVLVRGKFERDDDSSRMVAAEITPLDLVRERAVREVEIHVAARVARERLRSLVSVLERHPGDRRVSMIVDVNGAAPGMRVRTATAHRIRPSDLFVKDVEAICGAGSVRLK
jgi:DNA polymerase-3 subunit alpha